MEPIYESSVVIEGSIDSVVEDMERIMSSLERGGGPQRWRDEYDDPDQECASVNGVSHCGQFWGKPEIKVQSCH